MDLHYIMMMDTSYNFNRGHPPMPIFRSKLVRKTQVTHMKIGHVKNVFRMPPL